MHYFPDIPVHDSSAKLSSIPHGKDFRRISFENRKGAFLGQASSVEGNPPTPVDLDIAEIEERAFQRGFVEGQKTGFETARQQIATVLASLNETLCQLGNVRQEITHQIEKEVVELALAIAQKILSQKIAINPEVVLGVVREALQRVEDSGPVKIKMNPRDLEALQESRIQLSDFLPDAPNARFESEASITRGGCLIETDLGDIDARIEKQLQAVQEALRTELDKAVGEDLPGAHEPV
ncbi:MAG: flagellar assembly protein FliH [Desulfobacterales bacterium]|nr:MAG: flagellar assembly protein FliH [Desulfobacterales bacterium]